MYRALIVEDEPPILRKITSSLRAVSDAFDIEVAHDGQEAFEYLMNHPVDVVFTDIRMPIMDGLALSDKIRKLYPEICILIITGYYDYSYAKSAIQTGVFDYIWNSTWINNVRNVSCNPSQTSHPANRMTTQRFFKMRDISI